MRDTYTTVEPLEPRTMFSDTVPDARLSVPFSQFQITPTLSQGFDSQGKFYSTPDDKLVYFSLPGTENALTLQASAENTGFGAATGDLGMTLVRDANGDGTLEASELAAAIIQRVVPSQTTSTINTTLPAGGYFMLLKVANFNLPADQGVQEADVQATMTATSTVVAAPNIAVTGPTGKPVSPGSAATTLNGTDFGTFKPGVTPPRETFTVTDTGGAPMNLGPVFVPAGFSLISGLPPSLAAGKSASFVVQLNTATAGTFGGNIHFTTGVPGKDPFTFAVHGVIGTPPPPTTGSISGYVFDDYNHNGKQDAGDIPLAGRQVYIDVRNLGHYVSGDPTTTTNSSGTYAFANLKPGNYVVREVPAPWWKVVSPGSDAYSVPVTAGRNSGPYPFAEAPPASTPFGNVPFVVKYGATLQAENFDNGGEGVAYHDTDAKNLGGTTYRTGGVDVQKFPNGGYFVGYIQATEWLNYTVNVQTAGTYTIGFQFRPIGNNLAGNAKFHLEVDGVNVTGPILVPAGPFAFSTLSKSGIRLTAGRHVLRVFFDSPAPKQGYLGNFDSITFGK